MSKYDFEVDLSEETSTGKVLKKILPGSTVLEFGCATGRMTRYMKEALNCKVYIVEIDEEAFKEAMKYAEDGLNDDVLNLSWLDKFKDIRYDAILFVDILEHLAEPDKVLSNAKELLESDGKIYISIPNITHNDVLLKAFNNQFEYTDIGLLDNTHVHFWGFDDIAPFIERCGLDLQEIEATYCDMGQTEQYVGRKLSFSQELLNFFRERQYGDVYQFIITASKHCGENLIQSTKIDINQREAINCHIYFDKGNDFNEKDVIEFKAESINEGRYIAHYVITDTSGIKQLRFDPVELQNCIIQNLSIRQNGKELSTEYSEYISLENGYLMLSTDPMIIVKPELEEGAITIDADIVISGTEFYKILIAEFKNNFYQLENVLEQSELEISTLKNSNHQVSEEKTKLEEKIISINSENEQLIETEKRLANELNSRNNEKDKLEEELVCANNKKAQMEADLIKLQKEEEQLKVIVDEYQKQIEKLSKEYDKVTQTNKNIVSELEILRKQNAELQSDIGAYINLSNSKDKLIIVKNRVLNEKDQMLRTQEEHINELTNKVDYYHNRFCVRVCDRFWRILHRIERVFKRR